MQKALPHWMTYDAEVDGAAASIRCDLALFDREARPQGTNTLFVVGATLHSPSASGLSTPSEEAAIERARAALTEDLATFEVAIAGSVISRGSWQTFFYGSDSPEEDLIPTAQRPLRAEGWSDWIQAESDPEWTRYSTFLLPSTAERIRSVNERATQSLSTLGLDLSERRTLTHTLTFPSPEAAELSLSSIIALDFELAGPVRTIDDHCTKAKVSRQDPPDHAGSAALMLSELCAPYDGDHIRWTATE